MKTDFKRPRHQAIALVLSALDGDLLARNNCLFGGGTAITLLYGEYRESMDMDFLVSDIESYRHLRQLVREQDGAKALARLPLQQTGDVRMDQYGIRTQLSIAGQPIKFEIIFESRIKLDPAEAGHRICGIATLSNQDLIAGKLLANSDRWGDEGIFNRDVIDLAMMSPEKKHLKQAMEKAAAAYGDAVRVDLLAAIERIMTRERWLERCMTAMDISIPRAVLWKNIRALRSKVS